MFVRVWRKTILNFFPKCFLGFSINLPDTSTFFVRNLKINSIFCCKSMQDFQFLFVFIFWIILEIYTAHFSSHKNCAPYWQLRLHKAFYLVLTFQFRVQKNLLIFNNLIFFRVSCISNFVHYFDWSNSWIVWVFLGFSIILHVVQFDYTVIIHMLLISLLPIHHFQCCGYRVELGWSGVCFGPVAMFSLTAIASTASHAFQAFGFLFAFSFCNLCRLFLLFVR